MSIELKKIKRRLELIDEVVTSEIYNLGGEFFNKIVIKLNEVLDADFTFIGQLSDNQLDVETISLVDKNGYLDNFIYTLKGTPCEVVLGNKPCSYSKGVSVLFPDDKILVDMGIEAYVGVTLYDSKKNPTGILVSMFKDEIDETELKESILMIFASRAGAELEHIKLNKAIEKSKEELEDKVRERTKELVKKNIDLMVSNKRLEEALQSLQNTQTQLIQAEKMATLGILTSGVAHEINNPLNYISGAYTSLVDFFEDDSNEAIKQVDDLVHPIKIGVERISKIVKGLNQFSRNNENYDETCDIHEIINNCLTILNNVTKFKVDIKTTFTDQSVIIKGNSGKLHQVFLNILDNAIDAIPGHGELIIITDSNKNGISVSIKDNGEGIEKEVLNKLFEPFFTTKPPGKGTGLGLSISMAIIKEHKGKLEIDSEIGKGTKVLITLPS